LKENNKVAGQIAEAIYGKLGIKRGEFSGNSNAQAAAVAAEATKKK